MKLAIGNNVDHAPEYEKIKIDELKDKAENSECLAIWAPNLLDEIHYSELDDVLNCIISKMSHGCTLHIGGTDICEFSKRLLSTDFNIVKANDIIFGVSGEKQGAYSLNLISSLLSTKGLKIISKKLVYCNFVIEAIRE